MDTVTLAGTGLVILGLVVWIVCIVTAYRNAPRRGHRTVDWALLTFVFGPLALFALSVMAPKHTHGAGRVRTPGRVAGEGPRGERGAQPAPSAASNATAR